MPEPHVFRVERDVHGCTVSRRTPQRVTFSPQEFSAIHEASNVEIVIARALVTGV